MPDIGCVGSLFAKLELKDETAQGREKARSSFQSFSKVLMPIGTALTGVGAGLLLCDQRAKELGVTLGRVSVKTNIAESALRDMTLELANADFVLDQVAEGMEALSVKGIKNEEQMRKNLQAYNTVADALGLTMYIAVEQIGGALELFGYRIDQITEKQDIFSYVLQNSIGGIDEYLYSFERLGVEIRESAMTLEQYTALYLTLESRGLKGRAAVKALREALNESEGDFQKLVSSLGITTEELQKHFTGMEEAAGLTEKLDKVTEENITTTDKFKASIDKLRFAIGSYLEPLSFLGPVLSSLGPIMMSLSMASKVWGSVNFTVVAPSLTAVTVAGFPLWLVLGGIAAAVLAIIVVFKKWGAISDWFERQISRISRGFSSIKEKLSGVGSSIKEKLSGLGTSLKGTISKMGENIGGWKNVLETAFLGPLAPLKVIWDNNWLGIRDTLKTVFSEGRQIVIGSMQIIRDATIGRVENMVQCFKELPEKVHKYISDAMQKVIDAIRDKYNEIKEAIGGVVDRINPLNWDIPGLSPFLDAFHHAGLLASDSLFSGLEDQARKINAQATFSVEKKSLPTTETNNREIVAELRALRESLSQNQNVEINFEKVEVRSEQDIPRIAEEIKRIIMNQRTARRGT